MSRRRTACGLAVLCLVLLVAAASGRRQALACELAGLGGYRPLQPRVLAAADADRAQARTFRALVAAASARLEATYGAPASRPRIVFAGSAQAARRLGANDTATLHRAPWGSCIVVGPQGRSVDVVAHEWLHAEIQHRVGFWRSLRQVPAWFDEGVALTVDHRAPFLPGHIHLGAEEVRAVRRRVRGGEFFAGDGATVHARYQAARLAVLPLVQPASLYPDLARIAGGESFEEVFGSRVPAD